LYFPIDKAAQRTYVRGQGVFVCNYGFLLITGFYLATARERGVQGLDDASVPTGRRYGDGTRLFQHELSHESVKGGTDFVFELSDVREKSSMTETEDDALVYVARLLEVGQVLFKDVHQAAESLCQVVMLMTQGRAQLMLYPHVISIDPHVKAEPSSSSYPVCCNESHYGMVQVNTAFMHTTATAVSPSAMRVVAQVCGLLLYSFEMSALMQTQRQSIASSTQKSLTAREQAILGMMRSTYSNREIADTLQIEITTVRKHQQGIYRKLEVKSKYEALLVSNDGDCRLKQ
jgi:DNA-binding CsgD family transcriptional regulator